jgi:uncharacterized protein
MSRNRAHLPAEPVSVGEARAGAGGTITAGDNAIFYVGNLRCEAGGFGEGPALKAQCRVELLKLAGRASTAIACGGKHRPMAIVIGLPEYITTLSVRPLVQVGRPRQCSDVAGLSLRGDAMRMLKLLLVLLVWAAAVPAVAGPFEDGADAYRAGDYATALRLWRPLADAGNANAQFRLGYMYHDGQGVPQDYEAAAAWYRKAAEQGNKWAQYLLGLMYGIGQGVPQDHAATVAWYRKAAEQGHAFAQLFLGITYQNGKDVPQDYAAAAAWYRRAAEQGNQFAQFNLGVMYEIGQGVPQDYVLAHMWFNLAAVQNHIDAIKNRDLVSAKMTPAQIADAWRQAREWKPKPAQ